MKNMLLLTESCKADRTVNAEKNKYFLLPCTCFMYRISGFMSFKVIKGNVWSRYRQQNQ